MREAAREESLAGNVVVMPQCNLKISHPMWDSPVKIDKIKLGLDVLHLQKIRLCEGLLVVSDHTGYIGDSTKFEIAYAKSLDKIVRYWGGRYGETS